MRVEWEGERVRSSVQREKREKKELMIADGQPVPLLGGFPTDDEISAGCRDLTQRALYMLYRRVIYRES